MFEGYFDESGNVDEEPGVFCISGYFIHSDQAKLMDAEWDALLRDHNIPYFHMVDCAHNSGVFANIPKDECIVIEKKCIELIKKYTLCGFSALAHVDAFEVSKKYPNVYSACVDLCVTGLFSFLDINRLNTSQMACFFEAGHKNRHSAYKHVANRLERFMASLTFATKEQVRLLQAADLLAWQSAKYVKDQISGSRPPRKDFLSLMEHRHSLLYLSVKDDKPAMAFEDFPLSFRSPMTAILRPNHDGPITYLMVDGDDSATPIIPVKGAPGWALGPGRMALVQFQDFFERPFFLAFDETRLYESVLAVMSATECYNDSEYRPVIAATDVSVKIIGEELIMRLQVTPEANVHFRTTKSVAKTLLSKLKKIKL